MAALFPRTSSSVLHSPVLEYHVPFTPRVPSTLHGDASGKDLPYCLSARSLHSTPRADHRALNTPNTSTSVFRRSSTPNGFSALSPYSSSIADFRELSTPSTPNSVFRQSSTPNGFSAYSPYSSMPNTPNSAFRQSSTASTSPSIHGSANQVASTWNPSYFRCPKAQFRQVSEASTATTASSFASAITVQTSALEVPSPLIATMKSSHSESSKTDAMEVELATSSKSIVSGETQVRRLSPKRLPVAAKAIDIVAQEEFPGAFFERKMDVHLERHENQVRWLKTALQQMINEHEEAFSTKEKLEAKEAKEKDVAQQQAVLQRKNVEEGISARLKREMAVGQNRVVVQERRELKIQDKQEREISRVQRVAEEGEERRSEVARRHACAAIREESVRKEGERIHLVKLGSRTEKVKMKRAKSEMIARDARRMESYREVTNLNVKRVYDSMKAAVADQRARNVCDAEALQDYMNNAVNSVKPWDLVEGSVK